MARETIVQLIDDTDGSKADRTVRFSWGGTSYQIDLSAKNARAFEAAIQPYIKAGTRAPAGRSAGRRSSRAKLDIAGIREWAAKNGHNVSSRGRIPSIVLEAYHAAQHAVSEITEPATRSAAVARKAPAKKAVARKAPAKKAAARKAPAKKAVARKRPA